MQIPIKTALVREDDLAFLASAKSSSSVNWERSLGARGYCGYSFDLSFNRSHITLSD